MCSPNVSCCWMLSVGIRMSLVAPVWQGSPVQMFALNKTHWMTTLSERGPHKWRKHSQHRHLSISQATTHFLQHFFSKGVNKSFGPRHPQVTTVASIWFPTPPAHTTHNRECPQGGSQSTASRSKMARECLVHDSVQIAGHLRLGASLASRSPLTAKGPKPRDPKPIQATTLDEGGLQLYRLSRTRATYLTLMYFMQMVAVEKCCQWQPPWMWTGEEKKICCLQTEKV